jgi:two-component system CheB/CheR fusion protein
MQKENPVTRKTSKKAGAATPPVASAATAGFSIVGIGASAGGLEAFETFFRACPVDTGMAFVLVPHLDPAHESLLTDILQRTTAMPVAQAFDQDPVAPNHVYIIPPNREMAILNGVLQLSVPEQARGRRMPIDGFLRSLAEDQAEDAMGIILSGTAKDGTQGLRAIFDAGGICMVQEPSTAQYDGMPQSAIASGYATHILPVAKMPAMLQELVRQSVFRQKVPRVLPVEVASSLNQILLHVRRVTGHDFSLYKKSTVNRRVERRMAQNGIEDLAVYARFLKENPAEVQVLFKELLINVTSFFRDSEAFVALKQTILPQMLAGKPDGYPFRVWVAGCASGEEAYSIAMVLCEAMDEMRATHPQEPRFQIYATDLDDDAIATARAGCYPPAIALDVTPERLQRFFIKSPGELGGYKVKKDIREMVVFAVQNVVKDPPFTKLDLLSCRNLMIYLEPELQNRLIPTFHFALKADGVLFLSASESITNHPELFLPLDRKWKFYRAKYAIGTPYATVSGDPIRAADTLGKVAHAAAIAPAIRTATVGDLSNRALLQTFAPASVTTDATGNILYVHGDTGRYLRPAPGPMTNNVIDMAREGLQLELRTALSMAAADALPTLNREVSVKTNGGFSRVGFSVRRLPGQAPVAGSLPSETLLLVSFQDLAAPENRKDAAGSAAQPKRGKRAAPPAEVGRVTELEHELSYAKENLQAIIEEQQATNEELKSTNEELQSTNEELQSSNEELETSKEELQSLNEETITVNAALNANILELTGTQNDMKNLLDNVNVGTLFLDHQRAIRRYTREVLKIYPLMTTDVGRPLSQITSNIEEVDLLPEVQTVLDTLVPCEREVRTVDGAWYRARIQPYRTLDNIIEGVVLTFIDITAPREVAGLKLAAMQLAKELAEGIVETVSEPLIVLDDDLRVVSANHSFYEYFRITAKDTVGRTLYDLGNGQWNIPALRELLENLLPREQGFKGYVVEHSFPGLGPRRLVLNARRIVTVTGSSALILLAMVEIVPAEAKGTP